jgi:hypothetical protein
MEFRNSAIDGCTSTPQTATQQNVATDAYGAAELGVLLLRSAQDTTRD